MKLSQLFWVTAVAVITQRPLLHVSAVTCPGFETRASAS